MSKIHQRILKVLEDLTSELHNGRFYSYVLGDEPELKFEARPIVPLGAANFQHTTSKGNTEASAPITKESSSPSHSQSSLQEAHKAQNASEILQQLGNNCLVQLLSGEITLCPIEDIAGNDDIVAILAFPPSLTKYCKCATTGGNESSATLLEEGLFANCSNLLYIASIPEGAADLQFAFKGCSKLNCPIYIPSTAMALYNMLEGCESFSSTIFINSKQRSIPGLSSLPLNIVWNPK